MKPARLALALVGVLALPACGALFSTDVAQLDPKPDVFLARSGRTIALELAPEIGETFSSPVQRTSPGTLESLNVAGWQETLASGFRNGIGRYFATTKTAADLTFVVKRAVPTLVDVGDGAFSAQVRFAAVLLDANHEIVKTWADTARSRRSGSQYDAPALVRSAVEAMYEEIANGMPVPRATLPG